MDFEMKKLTVAEARELEKATGLSIGKIVKQFDANEYSMDMLAGVLYILSKRDNPDVTMEEIEALDLAQLQADSSPPIKAGKAAS